MWAALSIPVLWLALIAGGCCGPGVSLLEWFTELTAALNQPFSIRWTAYTPKALLLSIIIYGFGIALYYSSKGNQRPGEEHGSAQWGSPKELGKKYRDNANPAKNLIFTDKVQMGMDGRKHRRNLNVMVVGGSGAGKTRFYCKPQLLQANCSYIVCDPKGELLRSMGPLFQAKGIPITVLNLVDMACSDGYNPLAYLHSDTDAIRLVTNIIKNTTPKEAKSSDPFWEKAETALLAALILYLVHEAPEDEQNLPMVMYMIENAAAKEEDEGYRSPIDMLFEALEEKDPNHIALKEYRVFKQSAGKTAKSILVSAAVRLAAFNLPELIRITEHDDMDLGSLGERQRVLFAVIPDSDSSFNYIVGMLYSQAFQALYYRADHEFGGRLPIHVRVIMDEFANIALPDDFERILATCRSREISCNIVLQNLAQIKALFKDSWENLVGNCDTFLFLGGNEPGTFEHLSKVLGKATIDTRTHGQTKGRNGSWSTNLQNAGRELMTPDEIRMLGTDDALLLIRGERPVMDQKYNLKKHPNFKLIEDGGAPPYERKPSAVSLLDDLPRAYDPEQITILDNMEEPEHGENP